MKILAQRIATLKPSVLVSRFCLALALVILGASLAHAQPKRRTVLQAFWWDFRNNNYPQGWANYLADMAPRLREMGIEAVWIPVSSKNANPMSNGYSPFDHYDLGDKFQKNNLKTPMGDKDELLRMVAVMHANGIEVIQDIVLNHADGAGSSSGAGGQDSAALVFYRNNVPLSNFQDIPNDPTNGFKTFRYSSHATPVGDESAADFLSRSGRWPKNWQNFFPNPADNRYSGEDLSRLTFGPDIAFTPNAFGQASAGAFNPVQTPNYMRTQSREWMIWLKKQTGMDGWRLDAIKHYPASVSEDMLWNTQNNAGFASGGNDMFAVGEWVGGAAEMDGWVDAVQGRAGTFDFQLHGYANTPGLVGLVYGLGNYDMSNLPGLQQARRDRTVPFVNNHDTFRPTQPSGGFRGLDAQGNYPVDAQGNPMRWQSGSELSPNIDPREPRLAIAYAVCFAMDGNPGVFFEDLFDVGSRGIRYTHTPKDTGALRTRDDVAFLSKAHKVFNFKAGAYLVPHASADHLIIERRQRAIIGINDSWNTWQGTWITTTFAPGTRLIDYGRSSAATDVRVVQPDGRVQISTPPCNGSARRRGISVWAPEGTNFDGPVNITAIPTVQEWEMADDLGDSHPRSLQQGGAIPARSRAVRSAGKIYAAANTAISYRLFPSFNNRSLTLLLTDPCGRVLDSIVGTGNLQRTVLAPSEGWYQIRARNTFDTVTINHRVWIQASYTAPQEIDSRTRPSFIPASANAGPDRELCSNNRVINAFIDNTFTYQWTDGNGNVLSSTAALNVAAAGRYVLSVRSNVSGCTAMDTVNILGIQQLVLPVIRQNGDTLSINPITTLGTLQYQWQRNGVPIAGANDSTFRFTQLGNYTLVITTSAGCRVTSAAFAVTSLENALKKAPLLVYPNPAATTLNISLADAGINHLNYRLVGANGQVSMQGVLNLDNAGQAPELNVSQLPRGIYLLQLTDGNTTVTKKVMLQ